MSGYFHSRASLFVTPSWQATKAKQLSTATSSLCFGSFSSGERRRSKILLSSQALFFLIRYTADVISQHNIFKTLFSNISKTRARENDYSTTEHCCMLNFKTVAVIDNVVLLKHWQISRRNISNAVLEAKRLRWIEEILQLSISKTGFVPDQSYYNPFGFKTFQSFRKY